MSVPIQPLDGYVVAQAEESQTKTASGLYLPGNSQEKPKTATVIAIGKSVETIKVGDRIIYKNEYEATQVKVGKDDYLVVDQKNIIATVK